MLTALALAAPTPRSAQALAHALDGPGGSVTVQTVRSYVARLRANLGEDAIATRDGGYVLTAEVDTAQFEHLVAEASSALRAGDAPEALRLARRGLRLWRDRPFQDLTSVEAEAARTRFEQLRRRAVGTTGVALLEVQRAAEAAELLADECADAPLDEDLWGVWMQALHESGRRDRALAVFDQLRSALSTELGLEPGDAIQEVHARILGGRARPTGSRHQLARTPTVRYARRDGRAISYLVLGDAGPPLVYLHGMFCAAEMLFEEPTVNAFLQALGRGRTLVLVDFGGLGLSDPLPPEQLDPWTWAEDLRTVLEVLQIRRSPVISHMYGAAVALVLAAEQPHQVARLVISNLPSSGPDLGPVHPEVALADDVPAPRTGAVSHIPSRARDPEFVEWLDRSGQRGASPSTAMAIVRNFMQLDMRPLAVRVSTPTLVLQRDAAWPGPEHARVLGEHLQDGHVILLPGADAAPFGEGWRTWVETARDFADAPAAPPEALTVQLVAASRGAGGGVVVTVHTRPEEAAAALTHRLEEVPGSVGVLHAGLAAGHPAPAGPAVDAARAALEEVEVGVHRTSAFQAVVG